MPEKIDKKEYPGNGKSLFFEKIDAAKINEDFSIKQKCRFFTISSNATKNIQNFDGETDGDVWLDKIKTTMVICACLRLDCMKITDAYRHVVASSK